MRLTLSLLLIFISLFITGESLARINTFAQAGISIGYSRVYQQTDGVLHLGASAGMLGGVEYMHVYLRGGLGLIMFRDRESGFESLPKTKDFELELPIGAGVSFKPNKHLQLRFGCDFPFLFKTISVFSPSAEVLFLPKRSRPKGIFLKTLFSSHNDSKAAYTYVGVGFMLTF